MNWECALGGVHGEGDLGVISFVVFDSNGWWTVPIPETRNELLAHFNQKSLREGC